MKRITAAIGLAAVACAAANTPGQSPQPERQAEQASRDAREPRAYEIALEHNARVMAMPEEDKAWPVYRRVWGSLLESGYSEDLLFKNNEWAPTSPRARRFVVQHADLLDRVVEASSRPALSRPHAWPDGTRLSRRTLHDESGTRRLLAQLDDSHIQVFYGLGDLLSARALIAISAGEYAEALDVYLASGRIARHLSGGPLGDQWVGAGMRQARQTVASRLISNGDETLLDAMRNDLKQDVGVRFMLEHERAVINDIIECSYEQHGTGPMTFGGFRYLFDVLSFDRARRWVFFEALFSDEISASPAFGPLAEAARAELNERMRLAAGSEVAALADKLFRIIDKIHNARPWETAEALAAFEALRMRLSEYLDDPAANNFGALGFKLKDPNPYAERRQVIWTLESVTRAMLAVQSFRNRHGRLPDSLDEIDDDLLAGPMTSGTTGQPLRFTLEEDRPTLVLDGSDGDRSFDISPYID